jgi:hypothetical protein
VGATAVNPKPTAAAAHPAASQRRCQLTARTSDRNGLPVTAA